MRITTLLLTALAVALAGAAWAKEPPAGRDPRVWAAAERLRPGQLRLLEEVVNVDSGTGDLEGGRRVADIFARELSALGLGVERVPAEAPGLPDNLVARIEGTGRGRILLIGHLDTVFEPGTASARAYRTDREKAYGPGVGDEKGGVVGAVYALRILKELRFTGYRSVTLLIESSEERGSPGSRRLIARLLKDADVELNLEPGEEPDGLTVWRKGSNNYYIEVKGRAAHAGVAPELGRNAALELVHQIEGLRSLPTSGDAVTANLTLMSAGSRYNIIPDTAQAVVNVRIRERSQGDEVLRLMQANAAKTLIPDTQVSVRREISYPPLPANPSTAALAARAQAIYAGLGLQLATGGNGGASESALAAENGTPALDGLGPSGGGYHTDQEYINLRSVTPRLYLLTRLIMELGADPPPPMLVK